MKHLFALACLIVFAIKANAYDFSIGTNTFAFHFEDESLSVQAKEKILSDLEIMQTPWTNREYVLWKECNLSEIGYIFFKAPLYFPCFVERDLLNYFPVQTNQIGALEIVLSKKMSNEYKTAINFINMNRSAWDERTNFIARLSPSSLTNLLPTDVKSIIYSENISDEQYASSRDDVVEMLLSYTIYEPNMLGFARMPAGFLDYPEEALWLILPKSCIFDGKLDFDNIYCVWRNGHWYYWPVAW